MNLIDYTYVNKKDKEFVKQFIYSSRKKYIIGINKFTKQVLKYVDVDGVIDDFTRVQSSRKKDILKIDEVEKNSLILSVATGSPQELNQGLEEKGFEYFNYLAFYKYSGFELTSPPFMSDFEDDFLANKDEYIKTYDLLADEESKRIFEKIINFKISFDFTFMEGFFNNFDEQYFDKELIPDFKNITFLDGGAYVGDTLKQIIKNYPDYKKIYCAEPNALHLKIAKRDFGHLENVEFLNCGLGAKKESLEESNTNQHHGSHDYQATNTNTIDNLIDEKIDFIKLDIEGAEQDAIIGAKETIKKYTPLLAICIYHKANDWYKVPSLVLQINNEYEIYIRHYMEGIYETVMYFIPKTLKKTNLNSN